MRWQTLGNSLNCRRLDIAQGYVDLYRKVEVRKEQRSKFYTSRRSDKFSLQAILVMRHVVCLCPLFTLAERCKIKVSCCIPVSTSLNASSGRMWPHQIRQKLMKNSWSCV